MECFFIMIWLALIMEIDKLLWGLSVRWEWIILDAFMITGIILMVLIEDL